LPVFHKFFETNECYTLKKNSAVLDILISPSLSVDLRFCINVSKPFHEGTAEITIHISRNTYPWKHLQARKSWQQGALFPSVHTVRLCC